MEINEDDLEDEINETEEENSSEGPVSSSSNEKKPQNDPCRFAPPF